MESRRMRNIMAGNSHDTSFSFSRRHFRWALKRSSGAEKTRRAGEDEAQEPEEEEEATVFTNVAGGTAVVKKKMKGGPPAPARLIRLAFLAAAARVRNSNTSGGLLGSKVTGTLFGYRHGHVHFAFQVDPKSSPAVLIELWTPTCGLVREMASGLVRIALECEKKDKGVAGSGLRLLEEPLWRTFCNGKKCGYAFRRDSGPTDWNVLKAVEPVSTGAGVLPAGKTDGKETTGAEGEIMYMRARFERVVGSKDSEAFYMMNPDGNCGPELSIYLLRI